MKKLFWTLLAFTLLTTTSCQQKIDIKADEKALMKMNEEWDINAMAGDNEANAEIYTEDAIIFDDGEIFEGKEAIRDLLKSFNEITVLSNVNKIENIRISGDLATIRYSYVGSSIEKESGDTLNIRAAWVDICERQADGKWKVVLGMGEVLND